jgi:NAD(P)-dependent dehydrogenase (short-subunit alcohol dehydrogenase family)
VQITGGTSGIGAATARAFAAAGAKVAFCGRRTALGREVERTIRAAGGDATYIAADVRVPSSVRQFVDGSVRRYGRVDIAFNNAGVQINAELDKVTVEQWDDLMNTNARGVFLAMKHQVPHMRAAGGGHIIVNSSVGAIVGRPGLSTYQATKQAVRALVQSAALEYGVAGIRVNAILPGITDTPMIRPADLDDATWDQVKVALGQLNVDGLKRVAAPDDIARAVLALASDDLSYLTGAAVPVDGGIAAGRRMLLPELPS